MWLAVGTLDSGAYARVVPEGCYDNPRLAALYDLESPWAADTDFYISLASGRAARVLDVGCGTGTLTCGFAARGHAVTGVDPSATMLAIARQKPHADRVTWVESSAQAYRSEQPQDLIVMTGHAFQALLGDDDVRSALRSMRASLNDSGLVAFESRNPSIDWAEEWAAQPERILQTSDGPVRCSKDIIEAGAGYIEFRQTYHFADESLGSQSTLRFMSLEEITRAAQAAQLRVREVLGDWDGSAFDSQSQEMIFLLEATRAG